MCSMHRKSNEQYKGLYRNIFIFEFESSSAAASTFTVTRMASQKEQKHTEKNKTNVLRFCFQFFFHIFGPSGTFCFVFCAVTVHHACLATTAPVTLAGRVVTLFCSISF